MEERTKHAEEKPFFARYLEQQESMRVKTDVKAGRGDRGDSRPVFTTLKFPSDTAPEIIFP